MGTATLEGMLILRFFVILAYLQHEDQSWMDRSAYFLCRERCY
jgi:hypothetical protein